MSRWQFHDPVATDTYVFPKNPVSMGTIQPKQATTSSARSAVDGKIRSTRTQTAPFQWSFAGRLRSQSEYGVMLDWVSRPNAIQVTDHLGRVHLVLGKSFTPAEVAAGGRNSWLMSYTLETLYLKRIS